jgi:hypothetical protein
MERGGGYKLLPHVRKEIAMTNDEAINTLKNAAWLGWSEQAEKVSEAVQMAVEALKTQLPKEDTTSDCISRQEAIRIASGYCHPANVAKELAKLPSVQPYTDEEIQKMQDMEQAEIEKAFELGQESTKAEIIHCGKCKHKGTKNCVANAWTTIFGVTVKDDFYCGLAERRTDGRD